MKLHLLILILLLPLRALCDSDGDKAFLLLSRSKQAPQLLPYFLKHAPTKAPKTAEEAVTFGDLPAGQSAHLAELGHMGGSRMFSVRFLSEERLNYGNAGAVGMVVLASTPEDQKMFVPLIVVSGGVTDDYIATEVRAFGTTALVWVRKQYSGTGGFVDQKALMADSESGNQITLSDPLDATDPLADLKKQGWELWHRGNGFNEATLTYHFHLYKEPDPKKPGNEYPHRRYKVPYTFKNGKFVPGKPVQDPEE